MQPYFQSDQHCSAIHQLHFLLPRWSGHPIKLEASSLRSSGHDQLGEDPALTGGIIYVSHLAWMLRDPPGGSGEMLLGWRTSGTPSLACCCHRALIPVTADITDGLPQFLLGKKKNEIKKNGMYTKQKVKQRIASVFIQVVWKQQISMRRVWEKYSCRLPSLQRAVWLECESDMMFLESCEAGDEWG